LAYISAAESISVSSKTFTQSAQKATGVGEKQPLGLLRRSRSPSLVPIESSYGTSYQWLIVTYLLSCTVSEI